MYLQDLYPNDQKLIETVGYETTKYKDKSARRGNTYYYYVTAANVEGESDPSNMENITLEEATFGDIMDKYSLPIIMIIILIIFAVIAVTVRLKRRKKMKQLEAKEKTSSTFYPSQILPPSQEPSHPPPKPSPQPSAQVVYPQAGPGPQVPETVPIDVPAIPVQKAPMLPEHEQK